MSRLGKRRLNCASEDEGVVQHEKRRNEGLTTTFRDAANQQQFGDPQQCNTGYFQTANYVNSSCTFSNDYGALESGPAYLVQQVPNGLNECFSNITSLLPLSHLMANQWAITQRRQVCH